MRAAKRAGSSVVKLQVAALHHAVLNVSSALVDQAASIADNVWLAKRRNTGRHYDDVEEHGDPAPGDAPPSDAPLSFGGGGAPDGSEAGRERQRATAHAALEAAMAKRPTPSNPRTRWSPMHARPRGKPRRGQDMASSLNTCSSTSPLRVKRSWTFSR